MADRRDHNRLGFAVQLGTVRFSGWPCDPTNMPAEVVNYAATQLQIADPSCLKAYSQWEKTRLEHV
nr:DUF4158 domain-containing protein [Carbonactinospora thermoautotrophica]